MDTTHTRTLEPNMDAVQAMASSTTDGPLTMINLLRYKRSDGTSAEGVYAEYMQQAAAFLAQVGGRLVWMGRVDHVLIGLESDRWDRVLLVEYPSAAAFLSMLSLPGFADAQQLRKSALEETVLLAAVQENAT